MDKEKRVKEKRDLHRQMKMSPFSPKCNKMIKQKNSQVKLNKRKFSEVVKLEDISKYKHFLNKKFFIKNLKTHKKTGDKSEVIFEGKKRGNDGYQRYLYPRVKNIENKLKDFYKIYKVDGSRNIYYSNVFLFTITLNTEMREMDLKNSIKKFNGDMSYFKKLLKNEYGRVEYLKVMETHTDGVPHFHVLLLFENPVKCFMSKGKILRMDNKEYYKIKNIVKHTFNSITDLRGVKDKIGIEYVMKYLKKSYYHMREFYKESQKDNYYYQTISRLKKEKRTSLIKGVLLYVVGYKYSLRLFSVSKGFNDLIGLPLDIDMNKSEFEFEFLECLSQKGLLKYISEVLEVGTQDIILNSDFEESPPESFYFENVLNPV